MKTSRSTHLTMSSVIYPNTDVENEDSDVAGFDLSASFTSTIIPNVDGLDNLNISGLNSICQRQRQALPKRSQNQQSKHPETHKEFSSQGPIRVVELPGESRGRNQLLPRYWPRITDQELQQITSGDSNSTSTPLFEKMLSASDAGRTGRLVLPKACAEAYFPPISQPEGLPLKIQDVSGKNWVFQFRFWPNNNSRMYVLEGVTPCIQLMQLQAGDTVTFSRLEPEGKLVMGYRRAPNSSSAQDTRPVAISSISTEPPTLSFQGFDNLSTDASLTGVLSQSVRSGSEAQTNGISGQLNRLDTGYEWYRIGKTGCKVKDGSFSQSLIVNDERTGWQTSSESKRLWMDVEESTEFKISWEEAQYLLRPPPNVVPSIVTIEGYEFEKYEEPPVFGKRTIFTTKKVGHGEDQWAQCDDCGCWRRVPPDVCLPRRWACANNIWDTKSNSCDAPREVNNEEINLLLQHIKDSRKQEAVESLKIPEPFSGLEALANAATLEDHNATASSSPAPTTKHPRHRPGCTCIVCIQPPSGKGPKHKPTCNCNVCITVKRRFKTLMMRRKKRQSEQEAENSAWKKKARPKEDNELNSRGKWNSNTYNVTENNSHHGSFVLALPGGFPRMSNFNFNQNRLSSNIAGTYPPKSKISGQDHLAREGQIDLNSQPERKEEMSRGAGRVSMVRLLQNASCPLDRYLKLQGLTGLPCSQQVLVPSMSFERDMVGRKVDEHHHNQLVASISSGRVQDESCIRHSKC